MFEIFRDILNLATKPEKSVVLVVEAGMDLGQPGLARQRTFEDSQRVQRHV